MKNITKITLLVMFIVLSVHADEYFGRNKVQYKHLHWLYRKSANFTIYYPTGEQLIADYATDVLEETYNEYAAIFGHTITSTVPVIIYPSQSAFQETNITPQILPEGVGGFTEQLKHRVVVPFTGSYGDFRHTLRHELVHAFQYDILYGEGPTGLLNPNRFFQMPLWIAEGQAEYLSECWTADADMYLRDAILNDYTLPLEQLGGFLVYKEGESIMRYIAEHYGVQKLGELLIATRVYLSPDRAVQNALGVDEEKLYKDWLRWAKRRYFGEYPKRLFPDEIAHRLTEHEKDRSYFNVQPVLSPDGNKLIFISDRSDYTDLYLMDLITERSRRIAKGERSGDVQSFHPFRSRLSFSPDGTKIVYTSQRGGSDVIVVQGISSHRKDSYRFDGIEQISSPLFSPDGNKLLFSGLSAGKEDIYLYDLSDSMLTRITDDRYDDRSPGFSGDNCVIFSSDRPVRYSEAWHPGDYNLFEVEIPGGARAMDSPFPLTTDERGADYPSQLVSGEILYTSTANGVRNIYLLEPATGKKKPLTDLPGGAFSPSASADGRKIAFSAFSNGGWDIHTISGIRPIADSLSPTLFIKRKDSLFTPYRLLLASESDSEGASLANSFRLSNREAGSDTTIETGCYRFSLSADMLQVNAGYSTYYGLEGMTYLTLSDMLGNHQIVLISDLVYDIKNSNFYFSYGYFPHRLNVIVNLYHNKSWFKAYTYDEFSDEITGGDLYLSYPLSQYNRIEFGGSFFCLNRDYSFSSESPEPSYNLDMRVSYVQDNTLWRYTGPLAGSRQKLTVQYVPPIEKGSFSFGAVEVDTRHYLHLGAGYAFAVRLSAGAVRGDKPKRYWLGGTDNWLYPTIATDNIYSTRDVYFSKLIVPLRGYDYFQFSGTTYGILNLEFRYPFIQVLKLGFPPLILQGLAGGLFMDIGTAFDDINSVRPFRNGRFYDLEGGVGAGVRTTILGFLVSYDIAWSTDLVDIAPKPTHYISLGSEF